MSDENQAVETEATVVDTSIIVTLDPALAAQVQADAAAQETAANEAQAIEAQKIALGEMTLELETPGVLGFLNPAHRFFWKGKDMNNLEYQGSNDSGMRCVEDATKMGSATCHVSANPTYVEAPVETLPVRLTDLEKMLTAEKKYQDLKALVISWATDRHIEDYEFIDPAFVTYARNND